MDKIKFGTDGWRAIIADDFTVENLRRVAYATSLWLKKNYKNPSAVVGYDCRFGGALFSETTARVFAANGIRVFLAKEFVSTPMISLATKNLGASCGIIITASHNPASYNGFKIKGNYGGPALPEMIDEVENFIPESYNEAAASLTEYINEGLIEYKDLEGMYVKHAEESFDIEAIRKSGLKIAYDAMFGAGQSAVKRLLPDVIALHAEHNPGFNGQAPEPILKNLLEISNKIKAK
jgi:phosphomannomutase